MRTVVAWIEDFAEEELVEAELAFYAQDNDGNVWYLGEYPEEYEGGELVDAPAWLAGENAAKAGLMMPGKPKVGMKYYQEIAPGVAMDRAEIVSLDDARRRSPARCVGSRSQSTTAPLVGLYHDHHMEPHDSPSCLRAA